MTITQCIPEQIDIMINSECNARCEMCVQEITWKSPTNDCFNDGVKCHFKDYYELGGRKVIITGGEPTLRINRVVSVLEELSNYSDLELVAMYTNGSMLLKEVNGVTIAAILKSKGLHYVNLSVHHYEPAKNNGIFGIDVGNTVAITKHLRDIGLPFRFCATLQKGELENTQEILNYLEFARKCGAKDVYIRELFKISNVDLNTPQVNRGLEYIRTHFVTLKDIVNELKQQNFIQVGRRSNFQGRKKDEIAFEATDGFTFFTSELEIGKENQEELPYLVIMPNGKLYSTWMGEQFQLSSLTELLKKESEIKWLTK